MATLCGFAASCGGQGQASLINQDAYRAANHALYKTLPIYPGATLRSSTDNTDAQSEEDGSPIAGIVTAYVLKLPTSAAVADVAHYYKTALTKDGWRLAERLPGLKGHAGPVLNFKRGPAEVSINLESGFQGSFEIDLDHGRSR
jgi:hypothetical protein